MIHPKTWTWAAIIRHNQRMSTRDRLDFASPQGTVLADARFVNEVEEVIAAGGLALGVVRPWLAENELSLHASESEVEAALRLANAVLVNDGTLDDLRMKVREWVRG